jgi:RNA polymerase sigma factor (sigma-70 family)
MPRTLEDLFEGFRRRGEVESLGEVFDRTSEKLLAIACHVADDLASAEDLVQSTFLSAIESAQNWDSRRPLTPWLLGILAMLARRRRHKTEPWDEETTTTIGAESSAAIAERREIRALVESQLDSLAAPYREVARHALHDEMSPREIAAVLGRSPGTVRVQLHRALEQLRKRLPRELAAVLAHAVGLGRGLDAIRARVVASGISITAPAAGAGWVVGGVVMTRRMVAAVIALLALGAAAIRFATSPTTKTAAIETVAAPESAPARDTLSSTPDVAMRDSISTVPTNDAARPDSVDPSIPRNVTDWADRVFGFVHDFEGRPVSGAEIEVRRPDFEPVPDVRLGELLASARSDAVGRFCTERVPAFQSWKLHVRSIGFAPRAEWVCAGSAVDVDLESGVTITGRVVDARTREPMSGVSVTWAWATALEPFTEGVVTDDSGTFRLDSLAPGVKIQLLLRRGLGWVDHVLTTPFQSDRPLEIAWRERRPLRGRLVARGTDEPIANARIFDGEHANWTVPAAEGIVLATSDAAGEFRIDDVPISRFAEKPHQGAGRIRLVVAAEGFVSTEMTIDPVRDDDAPIRFELERGVDLAGVVVDADGAPIRGVLVGDELGSKGFTTWGRDDLPQSFPGYMRAAAHCMVVTDAQGRFAIHGVESSRSSRTLILSNAELDRCWPRVTIAPDADFQHLRLVLKRSATLEGIALIAGRPQSARVFWRTAGAETFSDSVVTNAGGSYRLTGLPEGKIEVAAVPPGYLVQSIVTTELPPPIETREFEVTGSDSLHCDFDLRTVVGHVTGKIHDPGGKALRDVAVTVTCLADEIWFEQYTTTDREGRFDVTTFMPPESADRVRFRIVAEHASVQVVRDDAKPGENDRDIEIPGVTRTLVRVMRSDRSTPVRNARFVWRRPDEDEYHFPHAGDVSPRDVALSPAGETELELPSGRVEVAAWETDGPSAPA